MIRWKGVITLIIIIGLFFALSFFLTDKWVEKKLESIGSSIVGAKVEIDNLDISFSQMLVSWSHIQVTDPKNTMKNMFETGNCEFDLEFWPLLSKKVIIEDFKINDFRTSTKRESDGALPRKDNIAKKEDGYVSKKFKNISKNVSSDINENIADIKGNINIDSVLNILDIQSVKKIDSLKTELTKKYNYWNDQLNNLQVEKDSKEIEERLKKIDIKKRNNITQIQEQISNINKIKKLIDKNYKTINDAKENLQNDIKTAKSKLLLVDDWIAEDYQRAYKLAKIPDFSIKNIAKILFGETLINKLNNYLFYFSKAREYSAKLKSDKPEKIAPPRFKGQDIYFYSKNARPNFWIKRTSLSGFTNDGLKIGGKIDNIVSDQRFINKPTTFSFKGANPKGGIKASINGFLNYIGDAPHENLKLQYAGFSLANTQLSSSKLLPNKLNKGVGAIYATIDLPADLIKGKIKFSAKNISFDFSDNKTQSKISRLIRDAVKDINNFYFSAKLSGKRDKMKVSIHSNLDKIIVNNIKKSINKEIEKTKEKINERINKEVNAKQEELKSLLAKYEQQLNSKLAKYQKMVDEQKAKADKKQKELQDKIDKEKSKLEDKVKDKLNKLF